MRQCSVYLLQATRVLVLTTYIEQTHQQNTKLKNIIENMTDVQVTN